MPQGDNMALQLPADVADELRQLSKILKRPPWLIVEQALERWVVEDEKQETLPLTK